MEVNTMSSLGYLNKLVCVCVFKCVHLSEKKEKESEMKLHSVKNNLGWNSMKLLRIPLRQSIQGQLWFPDTRVRARTHTFMYIFVP